MHFLISRNKTYLFTKTYIRIKCPLEFMFEYQSTACD